MTIEETPNNELVDILIDLVMLGSDADIELYVEVKEEILERMSGVFV